MGLLTPTRRVYHRWRNVLPLYDGRECPDCAAVICGRLARRAHRERHMREEQQQENMWDAIERLARELGIPVVTAGDQGDGYGRVDVLESRDDRLTRKARAAMQAPDDEDEDEDDDD